MIHMMEILVLAIWFGLYLCFSECANMYFLKCTISVFVALILVAYTFNSLKRTLRIPSKRMCS